MFSVVHRTTILDSRSSSCKAIRKDIRMQVQLINRVMKKQDRYKQHTVSLLSIKAGWNLSLEKQHTNVSLCKTASTSLLQL